MVRNACKSLKREFLRLIDDRSGTTAIEYGLLVVIITIAIMATLAAIGESIRDNVFGAVSEALTGSE
jgi:pilus assembly protein Flp/PilA